MKNNSIIIGCDHAGFELKNHLKEALVKKGYAVHDVGAKSAGDLTDYPVFISEVAAKVSSGEFERGIAVGGIGVGSSVVANRFPNVRAALCNDTDTARLSRAHTDSNVLVLGAWISTTWQADRILEVWLETAFEGGTHARRVSLIDDNIRLKVALQFLDAIETKQFEPETVDEVLKHKARKAIERIKALFGSERRSTSEERQTEFCPTKARVGESEYSALMIDLSEQGAQFRLGSTDDAIPLSIGDEIDLDIKTPFGHSLVKGKVMWVDRSFYFSWGVKFLNLSTNADEPLRSLMDSSM